MATNTKTKWEDVGQVEHRKEKIDNEPQFHVVYLGESGFPRGMAAMQKMILISKALVSAGAKVTIINRNGLFDPDKPVDMAPKGVYEGIDYAYTSGTIYRPKGFVTRNLLKIKSFINEFRYLIKLKSKGGIGAGIVSSHNFWQTLLYRIYGFILGFPVVLNYVEWASVREDYRDLQTKINDYLFDKWMVKWMSAAIPISEVLIDNFKKVAPGKPLFKIPVLCNFEEFNLPKRQGEPPYFLFCGSLGYKGLIDFILEAYNQLADSPYYLYLVVSGGSKVERDEFQRDIGNLKFPEKIKIFSYIPYSQLVDLYLHAKGLLIPLRPNLADAARFPHKIGEYSASGNPIITTKFGEVKYYFEDGKTALIADSYNTNDFAEKMKFVIDFPKEAAAIGRNGKKLGLDKFNHLNYSLELKKFLENLN